MMVCVHRKESLRLLRKMCRYVTEDVLRELCDESSNVLDTSTSSTQQPHPPFQAQISELLVVVLESDDDMESQLSGLTILQELLSKYGVAFDEQFVRLGLPNKIALLAGPGDEEEGERKEEGEEEEEEAKDKAEGDKAEAEATDDDEGEQDSPDGVVESSVDPKTSTDSDKKEGEEGGKGAEGDKEKSAAVELEDATEIVVHTPYRWREWSAVRSRDCLYLWNGFCAVELSTISNGWFRFLIDNKLATMYSSGSTEGGAGSFGEW